MRTQMDVKDAGSYSGLGRFPSSRSLLSPAGPRALDEPLSPVPVRPPPPPPWPLRPRTVTAVPSLTSHSGWHTGKSRSRAAWARERPGLRSDSDWHETRNWFGQHRDGGSVTVGARPHVMSPRAASLRPGPGDRPGPGRRPRPARGSAAARGPDPGLSPWPHWQADFERPGTRGPAGGLGELQGLNSCPVPPPRRRRHTANLPS
jgi:hypothetical protein